MKVSEQRIN